MGTLTVRSEYYILATIKDVEACVTFTRRYKKKGAFVRACMHERYSLVDAVEFPSLVIIKPSNLIEWSKRDGKK